MRKVRIIAVLYTLLYLFLFTPSAMSQENRKKVLFISSYSYDWVIVPKELDGYTSAINSETTTHYLFMDTKKVPYQKDSIFIKEFYSHIITLRNAHGQYDIVVAADDAALIFVLDYKDELFKDIPIVFLGIDNYDLAKKAYETGQMTGYFESHFDSENLDLASKLLPDMQTLFVITDDTISGKASRAEFQKALAQKNYNFNVSYINSSNLTYEELQESISSVALPNGLYLLNMTNDKYGNYYAGHISERLSPYVKTIFISPIGQTKYCTAGIITDYFSIGRSAALTVNKILSGTKVSDIPISIAAPSREINYTEAKKYNINLGAKDFRRLRVINKPESYFKEHYKIIFEVLVLLILVLLLTLLIIAILDSKKKEKLIVELQTAKRVQIDFLSKMSHDMRTPMNAIIGLSEFGLTEPSLKKDKSFFKQILSSSHYLLGLLNDLLDMASIEKGKISLCPSLENTENLTNEILTIINPLAEEKGIKLKIDFSKHVFRNVLIDKQRIKQVLINVLNNAVKYTPKGGTVEWVIKDFQKDEKDGVAFEIKDNGIGISKEFQHDIFKPFAQEFNAGAKSTDGSGLGLAITKSLVTLMNGEISFSSEKNKGSSFYIFIPIYCSKFAEQDNEKIYKDLKLENEKRMLKGKSALICDDNEINRMIAEKLMQDYGITTETAENGLEAVEKVKAKNYDFILMDIRMPVMDGIEAAKKIREFNAAIPIIAVSANAYESDKKASIEAGMNAHETKPLSATSLYRTISALL